MAEKPNGSKYAYLDQLSTPALEELLRADAESPESGDEEAISYILEVMEKRTRERPGAAGPDVEQSWREFQTVYDIPEGEGRSLYPGDLPDTAGSAGKAPRKHVRRPLLAAALVALIAVLLAVPVSGSANILEVLGKWANEQFSFFSADARDNKHRIPLADSFGEQITFGQELRDALQECGITEDVVPRWAPDGFVLSGNIVVQEYYNSKNFDLFALYNGSSSDFIAIDIIKRNSPSFDLIYEKNAVNPETYMSNGTQHYILENNLNRTAVWYIDALECSISTTLSKEEIKQMIDSIYEYKEAE